MTTIDVSGAENEISSDVEQFPELVGLEATSSLLSMLAASLETRIARQQENELAGCSTNCQTLPTPFHGNRMPPIPIHDYLRRIAEHSKCSPVCFILAYNYIHRLQQLNEKYRLCHHSVHRLVISGVLIAVKLTDDKFFSNSYFAKIGGISNREMNRLEMEMLRLLNFEVFVNNTQILREVRALRPVRVQREEEEGEQQQLLRWSKKRGSGDAGQSGSLPPTKFQHDLHHNEVLVSTEALSQQAIAAGGD